MDDDGVNPDDDDDLVQLNVTDVRVAVPAGNGVEAGLVVLEEVPEPHRQLRMYVGQPEARAIHASWSQTVPPRPSTWDLFISTISLLDARIDRAVINDVEEERHYFAQLVLHRAEVDDPLRLTARPSDAIALALRGYGARLYARPHVLDAAGVLADGSHWVRPEPPPAEFDPSVFDAYIAPRPGAAPDGSQPDDESRRDAETQGDVEDEPAGRAPAAGPEVTAAESEWEPDRAPVSAEVIDADPGDPAGGRVPEDRVAAAADRAAAARSARAFRGAEPA